MERQPCPHRILDDVGGAFAMGAVGGGAWNAYKGLRNSPKGEKFAGMLSAVKARSPVLGGNFGVWGGLFASFDCALSAARHKEDPWNPIVAGAMTSGVLAARSGWRAAARSAAFGGVILAMIEGFGIMLNRMLAPLTAPQPVSLPDYQPTPLPDAAASAGPVRDQVLTDGSQWSDEAD